MAIRAQNGGGLALAGIVFAGCAPYDGALVGGDASARALVRAEIASLEAVSLPFELCGVTLTDDPATPRGEAVLGYYDRGERRVVLGETAPDLALVARHEVCHAIDFQNDVTSGPDDDPWPLATESEGFVRRGLLREESFALWCQLGPESLALSPRAAAHELLDRAFPGAERPEVRLRATPVGRWSAPDGLSISGVTRAADGSVIVSMGPPGPVANEPTALDPRTCLEVPLVVAFPEVEDPPPLPWGWFRAGPPVDFAGGLLAVAELPLPDRSSDEVLVFWRDGWHRVVPGGRGTWRTLVPRDGAVWDALATPFEVACSRLEDLR